MAWQNENKVKEFKRDQHCTFFANWADILEKIADYDNFIDKEHDVRDTGFYRFTRAILDFSLYDVDPDFSSDNPMLQMMLETLWTGVSHEIQASLEKRAGFCEDRSFISKDKQRIIDTIVEMTISGDQVSTRKVSMRVFGTETRHDTVRRVQAKYKAQIERGILDMRNSVSQPATMTTDTPEAKPGTQVYHDKDGGTVEITPVNDLESDDGELPF